MASMGTMQKKIFRRTGSGEAAKLAGRMQIREQKDAMNESRAMVHWSRSKAWFEELKKQEKDKDKKEDKEEDKEEEVKKEKDKDKDKEDKEEQEEQEEQEEAGWESPGPQRNDNEVEGNEGEDNLPTAKRGVIRVVFEPPTHLSFGSAGGIGSYRDVFGY